MKTYCVPSHKLIDANPLLNQGVLLTPVMLTRGLWWPYGGNTVDTHDTYYQEMRLQRSENQSEYTVALIALMEVLSDNQHFKAVVSIRWCSLTYRLVLAHRVWLSIFYGDLCLETYSHTGTGETFRPVRNFSECWGDPEQNADVWKERFGTAIQSSLKTFE